MESESFNQTKCVSRIEPLFKSFPSFELIDAALDGSFDSSILLNEQGQILQVNSRFKQVYGFDLKEVMGVHFRILWSTRSSRVIGSLERNFPPKWNGEVHQLRKNGTSFVARMAIRSLQWERKTLFLIVTQDLTEERKMQARLKLSEKMFSVGTLAAGVAHEVNNPLAYVLTNLELIQERLGDCRTLLGDEAEEIFEIVEDALEGADRVRQIIKDLKTFSRATNDQIGPTDVLRALRVSLQLARNELRHRARIVEDFEDLPLVLANETRLSQVFLNLIVNAAQAMPDENLSRNEIRLKTYVNLMSEVIVEISDNGIGIPFENQDQVFDPFFSTKLKRGGTGLGLSICHRILSDLGGAIELESHPDQGSTFRIRLQATQREGLVLKETSEPTRVFQRRAKILIIDDEPSILRALKRLLSVHHEVETAETGNQAISILRNQRNFDLIFCDLMMTDLSGMEIFRLSDQIKADLSRKMVFMTGGAFSLHAKEFLENVPNPTIEKPFDLRQITSFVQEFLENLENQKL